MAKAKKTAPKSRKASKPKAAISTDQYTPMVVGLTWLFLLLSLAFVCVAAWRY